MVLRVNIVLDNILLRACNRARIQSRIIIQSNAKTEEDLSTVCFDEC